MRKCLSIGLVFFLFASLWAQEQPDTEKLQDLVETYHSRLALMQQIQLTTDKRKPWMSLYHSQAVGGLEQDVYGGFSHGPQIYQGVWSLFFRRPSNPYRRHREGPPPPELSEKPSIPSSRIVPFRLPKLPSVDAPERPIPTGFEMVPADLFVAQLDSPVIVDRLETCMVDQGSLLTHSFGVNLQFQEALAGQLGLSNFSSLADIAREVYFVSEEVSVKPAAHFAVLLHSEASLDLLKEKVGTQTTLARVGDHLVLATSEDLLQRIRTTHEGRSPSMASQDDFRASFFALQEPRDGFIFVSTAFIERSLSPELWLLNQRRPALLQQLAFAQYEAMAFRCNTGHWPRAEQLEWAKGLNLSVSEDGIVTTEEAGSIYKPKPLSDMPSIEFSEKDKYHYERFKKAPTLWAPFGVAFGLSDKLWLQTDFTPFALGETTELLELAGDEKITFESIKDFPQFAPVQFHVAFDTKAVFCRVFEIDQNDTEAEQKINQNIRPLVGDRDFDLFKTFRNRLSLSMEVSERHAVSSIQSVIKEVGKGYGILVLTFHVTDLALCEGLLTRLKQFGGQHPPVTFSGIEATPLNLYIVAAYLVTTPKHIHLAFSEESAKKVCEALQAKGSKPPALISQPQNLLTQLNVSLALERALQARENINEEHLEQFEKELFEEFHVNSQEEFSLNMHLSYLIDMKILQESLGVSGDAGKYFRHPPEHVLNIPVEFKDGRVFLDGQPLSEVWSDPATRTETAQRLVEKYESKVGEHLQKVGIVQIGLELRDSRVFTRLSTELPATLKPLKHDQSIDGSSSTWIWAAGAAAALGVFALVLFRRR